MIINGKWDLKMLPHREKQWAIWNERPRGWEPDRLDSVVEHLRPGYKIFDIGAEQGDFSALWACHGAQVAMVEPQPAFWPGIKATWEMNTDVPPLGTFCGFATHPGEANSRPTAPYQWVTEAHGEIEPEPHFMRTFDYPDLKKTTIDMMTREYGAPDGITMDIEGAELQALRGGATTLMEDRPEVWVSVHPVFMKDYHDTKESLLLFMEQMEYNAEHLATDHEEHWLFLPR